MKTGILQLKNQVAFILPTVFADKQEKPVLKSHDA